VKIEPKVSSLGKIVILAGIEITIELYTLVPAKVAVRKE